MSIPKRLETDDIRCVKSVQIRTRNNPVFGHFSRSDHDSRG